MLKTADSHNSSLTGRIEVLVPPAIPPEAVHLLNNLPQMGDSFETSLDSTPQRNKLIDTIRKMDAEETKILQAYADNVLAGRA